MKLFFMTLLLATLCIGKSLSAQNNEITLYTYEVATDVFEKPTKNSNIIFKIPFGSKIKAKNIANEENWIFSYNNNGYVEKKKTVPYLSNYKKKYFNLRKLYSDCWCYSSPFEIKTELKLSSNKVFFYYKANVEYQEEKGTSIGSVVCRIFRKIEIRLSKANSYWLSKFSFSNLLTSRYFLLPH